eukprot:CAMPEP_0194147564 /NCGR_PEP_ID=MMETSP0152-20130528/25908_1 /TAXON_ID=1049557 /ORGANISM="Thalassiothrix antarctica, Strain L6-D1" /LENGTH=391 /DNA_ID=CAMNT_0038848473 /DNA_START=140 /DNA_END=1315 /DNA_ORIENTATION=-
MKVSMNSTTSSMDGQWGSISASNKSSSDGGNKLYLRLKENDWEGALKRLSKKPTDITACGEDGNFFLHMALVNKAPLDVVKALYEARPEAITARELEHNGLPLHVACESGLPLEIVEYLHEKHPDAVRETCHNDMLPLHLVAISNACRLPVLCFLLAAYPKGMSLKDVQDMTALNYVEHSGHPHSSKIVREFERGEVFWAAKDIHDAANSLPLLVCQTKWDAVLQRLQQYPEEATIWTISSKDKKRMLPVHYACRFRAPARVVKELAEVHPYGLSLACQDNDSTALHLACEHGCPLDVIWILLHAHADAASQKDALDLLPIHLACAHGASLGVIQALLKVYSEAVEQTDAKGYTPTVYAKAAPYPHSQSILEELLKAENDNGNSSSSSIET